MSLFSKKSVIASGHCDSYLPGSKKISISKIFFENRWRFDADFESGYKGLRPAIMKNINLTILCYLHDLGHSLFDCPHCNNFTFIWHTCKSRFCNKCGMKYQKIRSNAVLQKVFDVSHRHGVFTVPPDLRDLFLKDRSLLNLLFNSVNDTLSFVIGNAGSKKDSLIPCAVLTLHTFGRGLNWIPHIHVLLAEGGVRKDGSFKHLKHINYNSLRKSFQKALLDRLDSHFNSIEFKQLKRKLYREYPDGFYAYCPPSKHKTIKDCVDYVIRYVGRPVMAASRIDDYDYDLDHVIWHYTDHETNQRVDVYDSILAFMKKLIIHIPDEHFKMVRYIGGYATKKKALCNMIRKMVRKSHAWILNDKTRYRQFRIDTTGIDPLKCSCGHEMEFVEAFFPSGLEEQINEHWKLFNWKTRCNPLQVY